MEMEVVLKELLAKQKQRTFSTTELSVIRAILKAYCNEHFKDKTQLELDAIKIVWERVKSIHQQQEKEDKRIEGLW